jgi:Mo25-like
MQILDKLTTHIKNPDFNIQSDSYETFKEIFLFDREGDSTGFETFLTTSQEDIFKMFDVLEEDSNYFSMREGLKT